MCNCKLVKEVFYRYIPPPRAEQLRTFVGGKVLILIRVYTPVYIQIFKLTVNHINIWDLFPQNERQVTKISFEIYKQTYDVQTLSFSMIY